MYKVQKKDGTLEDFDRSKIVSGVVKAGGDQATAEKVATEVETWLTTAAVSGVIPSVRIKEKVLESLRAVNPQVAETFESYVKPAV